MLALVVRQSNANLEARTCSASKSVSMYTPPKRSITSSLTRSDNSADGLVFKAHRLCVSLNSGLESEQRSITSSLTRSDNSGLMGWILVWCLWCKDERLVWGLGRKD